MAGLGSVSLAGFDFLAPDTAGVEFVVQELTGWWDTPASRGDDTERVGADGDFPAPRTYGPRMVTVAGSAHGSGFPALFAARDRVAGLLYGGPAALRVDVGGSWQEATVERSGALQWETVTDEYVIWSLTVKAPDPRKYGVTRVFGPSSAGTSVQVFHSGNYPASPTIEVLTGSYMPGGFTAWGTGEDSFRVLEGVNSNEVLSADFETGLIRKNGAVIFGQTGYTELARVLPGRSRAANVTLADPVNGYGSYRVVVRDTFI